MEVGSIVYVLSGYGKNCFMAVVGEKDGRLLLADGKSRKIDNPKPKNVKHISVTENRLSSEQLTTDKLLRKALRLITQKGD